MSHPVSFENRAHLTVRERCAAHCAVTAARALSRLSPHRLCRLLERIRRGARPATAPEALRARHTVVTVSRHCAGNGCLPRSVATALFCRLRGRWPQWCTGYAPSPSEPTPG
ncbi:lasso peptide biosynthesis B2 protein [Streptomyces sp. NRRL S-337]|uniref:lasso peptide biosynthesis B2 protein n=1 Tax=Streptomyces sp. NRRL S-337 TaxID=1463900 RepID=UPI000AEAB8C9|nr:lasso peptide biosynthesis B2 protein [Streptomyces sp. NRRL S-337]